MDLCSDTFTGPAFHGSQFHGGSGIDTVDIQLAFNDAIVIEPAPLTPDSQVASDDPVFVIRPRAGAPVALTFSGVERVNFLGGFAEPNTRGGWDLSAD